MKFYKANTFLFVLIFLLLNACDSKLAVEDNSYFGEKLEITESNLKYVDNANPHVQEFLKIMPDNLYSEFLLTKENSTNVLLEIQLNGIVGQILIMEYSDDLKNSEVNTFVFHNFVDGKTYLYDESQVYDNESMSGVVTLTDLDSELMLGLELYDNLIINTHLDMPNKDDGMSFGECLAMAFEGCFSDWECTVMCGLIFKHCVAAIILACGIHTM